MTRDKWNNLKLYIFRLYSDKIRIDKLRLVEYIYIILIRLQHTWFEEDTADVRRSQLSLWNWTIFILHDCNTILNVFAFIWNFYVKLRSIREVPCIAEFSMYSLLNFQAITIP